MDWRNQILVGDCIETMKKLPAKSMHTCVTSPPYWGLRDYGTAKWEGGDPDCEHSVARLDTDNKGSKHTAVTRPGSDMSRCDKCGALRIDNQIGLEQTPEKFVKRMVEVFRGVWRILRDDGTLWLNFGDSYCATANGCQGKNWQPGRVEPARKKFSKLAPGLKQKDLCMMPARVAMALQADGWYLRSEIIWHKKNPMPESCEDRPTSAHEKIFLLTKSPRYFYDYIAIREKQDTPMDTKASQSFGAAGGKAEQVYGAKVSGDNWEPSGYRNKRNVWTMATVPFPGSHFATFPPDLIRPCVKAGSSEHGVCEKCGAPWVREVEKTRSRESGSGRSGNRPAGKNGTDMQGGGDTGDIRNGPCVSTKTIGWNPSCKCSAGRTKAVVFDPFMGAGTTALVAAQENRDFCGCELNPEYASIAWRRIRNEVAQGKML